LTITVADGNGNIFHSCALLQLSFLLRKIVVQNCPTLLRFPDITWHTISTYTCEEGHDIKPSANGAGSKNDDRQPEA